MQHPRIKVQALWLWHFSCTHNTVESNHSTAALGPAAALRHMCHATCLHRPHATESSRSCVAPCDAQRCSPLRRTWYEALLQGKPAGSRADDPAGSRAELSGGNHPADGRGDARVLLLVTPAKAVQRPFIYTAEIKHRPQQQVASQGQKNLPGTDETG